MDFGYITTTIKRAGPCDSADLFSDVVSLNRADDSVDRVDVPGTQ